MHDSPLAVRRLQILSSKDEEMDLGRSPSNVGSERNMQGPWSVWIYPALTLTWKDRNLVRKLRDNIYMPLGCFLVTDNKNRHFSNSPSDIQPLF
jgi:hypothetical protein